jgi:uncharacterized membrane protein YccF (DUF307 family)
MATMRVLGNILWFVFGGVFIGLGHILGGVGLCLTVVGIPFGLQAFKLGIASFAPFGKEVVERERANSVLRVLFNVVWILLFGWEIAVAHVVLGLLLALTLVGIPFALQHLKLVPLALLPFGRELEPVET